MKSCQLMTVNNSITINRFCFTRCFLYQSSGNQVTVFRDQRLTEYNLKFHLCWYFCSDLMSAHHREMNGSPGAGYLEVDPWWTKSVARQSKTAQTKVSSPHGADVPALVKSSRISARFLFPLMSWRWISSRSRYVRVHLQNLNEVFSFWSFKIYL